MAKNNAQPGLPTHYCECGALVSSHAAFCGRCGAALKGGKRFRVYHYSKTEAKANGVYASYNEQFVFAVVAPLVLVAVVMAAGFGLGSPAREIVGGISCVALIIGTIVYAFNRRNYMLASQYAYVWDNEDKVLYSVFMVGAQMYGWNTVSNVVAAAVNAANANEQGKRAQHEDLCIAYVRQYIENGKPAQKFWSMTTPSEVIVELRDIKVLKSTRRSVTVQYTNFKGKAKKMTIIKAFPGIEECYV